MWDKCSDCEYGDIDKLRLENKELKEIVNKLKFIRKRKNQGCSQETINKMAIAFVNNWLNEISE